MLFTVIYYVLLCSLLLIVFVTDLKQQLIYDQVLLAYGAAALVLTGIRDMSLLSLLEPLKGAAVGLFFYGVIYWIARLIYREEAFGSGDVFFLACLGLYLGMKKTLLCGFGAFYVALLAILFRKLRRKKILGDPIPFGPSICVSALVSAVFGDRIIAFLVNRLWGVLKFVR